jgi:hypothetical protein
MMEKEKRLTRRIGSQNILYYLCLDPDQNVLTQGMGRTLNLSDMGILLETHVFIKPEHVLSLTIGLDEDLMDFTGEVTHSREREDGMYETGVKFFEMTEAKREFLQQYLSLIEGQEDESRW